MKRIVILLILLLVLMSCEAPETAAPGAATPPPSDVTPAAPAATPEPGKWQVYWQKPTDDVPTRLHAECPRVTGTVTEARLRPGQRFEVAPSECPPHPEYPENEVVRVRLEAGGETYYAVAFTSFEPAPTPGPTPAGGTRPGWVVPD